MNPSGTARHRLAASALGILLLVNASAAPNPNNAKVDKLFAQWDRKDSPGAAIVVVKDGAVVYQHGYGCANLEHNIPITPQTRFDVASVAKQFTGLAVAMLIEQGKLSLDDDVRKHLPDVPDFGKPITLGHLVHHTSGLRDWPEAFRLSNVDLTMAESDLLHRGKRLVQFRKLRNEFDNAEGPGGPSKRGYYLSPPTGL